MVPGNALSFRILKAIRRRVAERDIKPSARTMKLTGARGKVQSNSRRKGGGISADTNARAQL